MWKSGVFLLIVAAPAFAQPTPPVGPNANRPTVSPYLNLLRGGSPAINYFGIVRPELQMQQNLGQLQQQLNQANQNMQGLAENLVPAGEQVLPTTGHAVQFNNTLNYFNRMPGGSGVNTAGRPGMGMGTGLPRTPAPPTIGAGMGQLQRFGR